MNNTLNAFNKTFKVSGVTFKNRQEHLKQLYEMNLPIDSKRVEINHTTSDGYDCLMVLFNDLEVGIVPRQDIYYFQDNSYDYMITNFHIGSFIGDYGQKIYYARFFVHFYVKEEMLKYLPKPTVKNTSPNLAESPKLPTATPPQTPTATPPKTPIAAPPQTPTKPLQTRMTESESDFIKRRLKAHKEFTVLDSYSFVKTYSINNYTDCYVQSNLKKLYNLDYSDLPKVYHSDIKYNREEIAIYVDNKKIGYIDREFDIDIILFMVAEYSCKITEISIDTYYDNDARLIYYPLITFLFHNVYHPYTDNSSFLQEILDKKPALPHSYYKVCSNCKKLNPYFRDRCNYCENKLFDYTGSLYSSRISFQNQMNKKTTNDVIREQDLNSDLHKTLELSQSRNKTTIGLLILFLSLSVIVCIILLIIILFF